MNRKKIKKTRSANADSEKVKRLKRFARERLLSGPKLREGIVPDKKKLASGRLKKRLSSQDLGDEI